MPEQSHFGESTLLNFYVFFHLIDSQLQCSYQISHQLARILILVKKTSGHFRGELKPTFLFDEECNRLFKKISYTKFSEHKTHI